MARFSNGSKWGLNEKATFTTECNLFFYSACSVTKCENKKKTVGLIDPTRPDEISHFCCKYYGNSPKILISSNNM